MPPRFSVSDTDPGKLKSVDLECNIYFNLSWLVKVSSSDEVDFAYKIPLTARTYSPKFVQLLETGNAVRNKIRVESSICLNRG